MLIPLKLPIVGLCVSRFFGESKKVLTELDTVEFTRRREGEEEEAEGDLGEDGDENLRFGDEEVDGLGFFGDH